MKRRGIVKGQTIEFDHPLGLADGQAGERQIGAARRQADEIRQRIRKELGGELNLSVRYVREDRER